MKKLLAATVISLCLLVSTVAHANQARAASGSGTPAAVSSEDSQTANIARSDSHPSAKGPAEYFTGSVRIDPLFDANGPADQCDVRARCTDGMTHPPAGPDAVRNGWLRPGTAPG